jgi:hypothetical protein
MTTNPEQKTEFRSVWIKTAEQQLFNELETEYGFPRAICRSLVQLMKEFIEQNYGNLRGDNQIIYHGESKDEPPGKQLFGIDIILDLSNLIRYENQNVRKLCIKYFEHLRRIKGLGVATVRALSYILFLSG